MTDKGVAALKPRAKRYSKPDSELRGHWVRVQPSGAKSFWAVTRNPDGKQVWTFIGPADAMSIEAAREKARSILTRVRAGLPAIEQKGETFGTVFDSWMKRHVEKNGLRSYRTPTSPTYTSRTNFARAKSRPFAAPRSSPYSTTSRTITVPRKLTPCSRS
jgi:hypothetical protein